MNPWNDLRQAAIIGTDRRPYAAPAGLPETLRPWLTESVTDAPATDASTARAVAPETRLLLAAGAVALHRRAGAVPPQATRSAPAVAPPETRRSCPVPAACLLTQLIAAQSLDVLPVWLEQANGYRQLVPPPLLPMLLDLGASTRPLRHDLAPTLGERGRWLAGLNPAWAWLLDVASETASIDPTWWDTGEPEQRLQWLRARRVADPGAARAALAASWRQEDGQFRQDALACLAVGLDAADEPFLEAALNDRARGVRQEAVRLLRQLPQSGWRTRIEDLAKGILRLEPGRGGRLELHAVPPLEWDKAWARDGVEEKPPSSRMGSREWWMRQVLESLPLSYWGRFFDRDATTLLATPIHDDWRVAVLDAWCKAAAHHPEPEWLEAVLGACLAAGLDLERAPHMRAAIPLLDAAATERLLAQAMARPATLQEGLPPLWLLLSSRRQWPDDVAQLVSRQLFSRLASAHAEQDHQMRVPPLMRQAVLLLPVPRLREFVTALADRPTLPLWLEEIVAALQLCTDLRLRLSAVLDCETLVGALRLQESSIARLKPTLANLELRLALVAAFVVRP